MLVLLPCPPAYVEGMRVGAQSCGRVSFSKPLGFTRLIPVLLAEQNVHFAHFAPNSNILRCRTSGPLGAISCLNFSPQPRAPRRSRTVQARGAMGGRYLEASSLEASRRFAMLAGLHISAL